MTIAGHWNATTGVRYARERQTNQDEKQELPQFRIQCHASCAIEIQVDAPHQRVTAFREGLRAWQYRRTAVWRRR